MSETSYALVVARCLDALGPKFSRWWEEDAARLLRRLHADNERLREELRQSSIDHNRAEIERLRGLLLEARDLAWSYGADDLHDRINEALQEAPR